MRTFIYAFPLLATLAVGLAISQPSSSLNGMTSRDVDADDKVVYPKMDSPNNWASTEKLKRRYYPRDGVDEDDKVVYAGAGNTNSRRASDD
ncbi:MAG: hypothetical protein Q9227_009072 [Pyrenula ochraceoflavens]